MNAGTLTPWSSAGATDLTLATGRLLGRSSAGTGPVEALQIGSGLSLSSGILSATGGGGGGAFDGIVDTYADLPVDGTAGLNAVYLVRNGSGTWLINRKQPGLYERVDTTGDRATDWQYLGEWLEEFSDANFAIYNDSDNSKVLEFDLSGITTGTVRTLTVPDASGTIAVIDAAVELGVGDLLYASGATTLTKLAAGSSSQVLIGGTSPAWTGSPSLTALTLSGLLTAADATLSGNITLTASSPKILVTAGADVAGFITFDYPDLSTSAAEVRFLRSTSTTGNRLFTVFKGDGTSTAIFQINSKDGYAKIYPTTAATSVTSGALINAGGMGTSGAAYFGSNINQVATPSAYASGSSVFNDWAVTGPADAGGTTNITGFRMSPSITGSSATSVLTGLTSKPIQASSQTVTTLNGLVSQPTISSSGSVTTATAISTSIILSGGGGISGGLYHVYLNAPTKSSTGDVTGTIAGLTFADQARASASRVTGVDILDQTALTSGSIYAFRGRISSGTGKWNLQMDGSAPNLFAGLNYAGSSAVQITTAAGYLMPTAVPGASALTESSGAVTINCAVSNVFSLTLNANLTTVTLSNFADGQTIVVAITNTASNYTVTWGNSIKWSGGSQATQTVGAFTDVWTLVKVGSTIYGAVVQNLS